MPSIPRVYVDAPNYVEEGERFNIRVEVRVDDINRIDYVEVEGHERKELSGQRFRILDKLNMTFGPYSIRRNRTFKVVVYFDRRDRIVKYVQVKVKRRHRDDRRRDDRRR